MSRAFELQAPGSARLLPMEGLRGVAVFLVFLQHFGTQALAAGWPADSWATVAISKAMQVFSQQGNAGVELFFTLSGFLIYGHLVQRRPPFSRFMARRAIRLYPAFLCVFALAAGLDLWRSDRLIPQGFAQASLYVAANLAFLPGLVRIRPLVAVAWSLSYEVAFYLAAFALVTGLAMDRWRRGSRIALIVAAGVLFELACWWHGPNLRGPMRTVDLLDWDMPDRMLPFIAGMLLAEGVGIDWRPVPRWLGLAAPAAVLALLAGWWVPDIARAVLIAGAFFLLCAACFQPDSATGRLFAWPWLRWLGNMSYSYYLVHGVVVALAGHLGVGLPPLLAVAALPAVFAASLLPAAALFLLVEKPVSLRPKILR